MKSNRQQLMIGWSGTMSPEKEVTPAPVSPLPADSSPGTMLLTIVLSVIAGSADVISFLGLGGLFVAQVTGNLILIAAHIVIANAVSLARLLSVPVFILALGLTSMLAAGLEARGLASRSEERRVRKEDDLRW